MEHLHISSPHPLHGPSCVDAHSTKHCNDLVADWIFRCLWSGAKESSTWSLIGEPVGGDVRNISGYTIRKGINGINKSHSYLNGYGSLFCMVRTDFCQPSLDISSNKQGNHTGSWVPGLLREHFQ